ncbi:MAG: hypothetical protein V4541_01340 [Bacteroidota bacterium]
MKKHFTYLLMATAVLCSGIVNAQTYTANVSKDSLKVLNARLSVLKANIKLMDLKIKESEEEAQVEKLGAKLLKANANAKESAIKNSDMAKKIKASTIDAKQVEKIAKNAKDDMIDAQKALDRYHKQIKNVGEIRSEIKAEESKLEGKKPLIIYK